MREEQRLLLEILRNIQSRLDGVEIDCDRWSHDDSRAEAALLRELEVVWGGDPPPLFRPVARTEPASQADSADRSVKS